MQKEGRDFDEEYAPTVRSDSPRILLGIFRRIDFITAFLYKFEDGTNAYYPTPD